MRLLAPALALLGLLVPWTQGRLEARRGAFAGPRRVLYVTTGSAARRLAPGFPDLAADVYWLRTVQYYGYQHAYAKSPSFDLLLPLVRITVALDPRLEIAYRYGATFVAEPWPVGAGDAHAAVALLGEGVRRLPQSWRLRQDLGMSYFLYLKDARQASKVLMEAARLPNAPPFLATLAAAVLARGGDRETARALWSQLAQQAEPGPMKNNALVHIAILDALDRRDALAAASREFARRAGRPARSLEELARSGLTRAPLVDPTQVPFDYNPETGEVSVSPRSILFRRSYQT